MYLNESLSPEKKNINFLNPCQKNSMASVSNLKSIINCIDEIKGQPANSASPTDIYILKMKDDFVYEGEHIKTIFMKTFISGLHDFKQETKLKSQRELDYEMGYEYFVYLSKIKDIVKLNICPYFVKVLGGSLKNSEDNMLELLKEKIKIDPGKLSVNFLRNMLRIYSNQDDRPSIETEASEIDTVSLNRPQLRFPLMSLLHADYGYIMTEGTENTVSLFDYIYNSPSSPSENEYYILLFQLIVACRAMNLAKLAHNDLHHGNILVEKKNNGDKCCFLTNDSKNNKVYALNSPFRIHIYDFDRSYVGGINPYENPLLVGGKFSYSSQSNNFLDKRDLAKVMSYFFVQKLRRAYANNRFYFNNQNFVKNIANVIVDSKIPNLSSLDILNNFYLRSGVFLQKDLYRGRNSDKDFEIFNVPWDVMLDRAYDLLPPSVKYDLTTQKGYLCNNIIDFNVYYLYPQIFDDEGNINLRELEKIKSSVIKDVCKTEGARKVRTRKVKTPIPETKTPPKVTTRKLRTRKVKTPTPESKTPTPKAKTRKLRTRKVKTPTRKVKTPTPKAKTPTPKVKTPTPKARKAKKGWWNLIKVKSKV